MRWVYIGIIVLFALIVLIFALQNLQTVRLSFLGFAMTAPVAIVVIAVYLLGMATGSGLFAIIKRSIAGSRTHEKPH